MCGGSARSSAGCTCAWDRIRSVRRGLAQTFADVFKLLLKEVIYPTKANRGLFLLAPLWALVPAFAAWAVIPIGDHVAWSNANAGLLFLLAMTSMGVYGIILAGWASNSRYAMLGAMRSAAQVVSYEIAMGFCADQRADPRGQPESLRHRQRARRPLRLPRTGSRCRCCRCSSSTSSPASPRRTARRSTSPKANRKSSRVSTSNIRARRSRCSS